MPYLAITVNRSNINSAFISLLNFAYESHIGTTEIIDEFTTPPCNENLLFSPRNRYSSGYP
ncbi:hypothetical protein T4C_12633 [Trichinella pseudospiralis]|uniref:Uncharacterized protein n=1 Tax=Trichinella pseudospiralis TaxID=6337 RepID=A0A0V1JPM8_TRIPS|nr:hypothetical protein T4C_12633 [Trichinella pseudospiralis]